MHENHDRVVADADRLKTPFGPNDGGVFIGQRRQACPLGLHAAARHDPVVRLAGDLGDAFEVGVVVQHGQVG